jgi:hypothetical protein
VTLEVKPAATTEPGTGNASGGSSGTTSNGSNGGGGSADFLSLLLLSLVLILAPGFRTPTETPA